jgi:MFS family permease
LKAARRMPGARRLPPEELIAGLGVPAAGRRRVSGDAPGGDVQQTRANGVPPPTIPSSGGRNPNHTHRTLVAGGHLGLAGRALLMSITTLLSIFSAPAGGLLSDRVGSRKKPYLAGLAAMIVLLPLAGALSLHGLIVLVIVNGLVLAAIPVPILAAAMESTGDERLGGVAMAVIMVGQNAGMLLGPLMFGALAEVSGWPAVFASLAVMSALGLWAGWRARAR